MHHDQTHSAPTGVIELRKIPAPTSPLRKRDTETRIGYMGTLGMAANPPTTDPRQMASAAWTYQYVVPNPADGVVELGVDMAVSLLYAHEGGRVLIMWACVAELPGIPPRCARREWEWCECGSGSWVRRPSPFSLLSLLIINCQLVPVM